MHYKKDIFSNAVWVPRGGGMCWSIVHNFRNNHMLERRSKIFGCFVGVRRAFDTVWIDGLLLKLFIELGIKERMWLAIKDLHTWVKAQILYSGSLSRSFDVSQGTRQGRILAPFMDKVYINSLLHVLSELCNLYQEPAVNFSIFWGWHLFTCFTHILSQCFHEHVSSVRHKVEIWIVIVYWLKYGKNSLIWLAERQSVHRRTDRRMHRATQWHNKQRSNSVKFHLILFYLGRHTIKLLLTEISVHMGNLFWHSRRLECQNKCFLVWTSSIFRSRAESYFDSNIS